MAWKKVAYYSFLFVFSAVVVILSYLYVTTQTRAFPTKANIVIDTRKIVGRMPENWSSFAQGGEESGVRMLQNIIPQITELQPEYIRIDHMYDFYKVLGRDAAGNLTFNWSDLDQTICDIYETGARPFLSLGYMPSALSGDESLISAPKNWNDWALTVQKTIERYSGKSTSVCEGKVKGSLLADTSYEVWNEPDLETFGGWKYYGEKNYLTMYRYSSLGASRAQDVYNFRLGGPATTAAYRNWFQSFITFVDANDLRLDFLSWHHYTKNPDDYLEDVKNINYWLAGQEYRLFRQLPFVISEWGYDSNYNPVAETDVGAAHTIASIRNLIDQKVQLAFAFELKDGLNPSWGILTRDGEKKPRYHALKFLNSLRYYRLQVAGEGTYVRAIASAVPGIVNVVFVNYDQVDKNTELVPVSFVNLANGTYSLTTTTLEGQELKEEDLKVTNGWLKKSVLMEPNSVVSLELVKK